MQSFQDFVREMYKSDPAGVSDFATTSCKMVKIKRSRWRGNRRMKDADVVLDGKKLGETVHTRPGWKLCPSILDKQFTSLEMQIEEVLTRYARSKSGSSDALDEEDDTAQEDQILSGNGRYLVDTETWVRVREMLKAFQVKWAETADEWCTVDGYQRLHDELKSEIGDSDYNIVKDLIPEREKLRSKFAIRVSVFPFKLAEESDTEDVETANGRIEAVTELLATAIRRPRLVAAEEWRSVANMLATVDQDGKLQAKRIVRIHKDEYGFETEKVGKRSLRASTLMSLLKVTKEACEPKKLRDSRLEVLAETILKELPDNKEAADKVVKKWNSEDETAVRIAGMLLDAAKKAEDNDEMCQALADAWEAVKETK